MEKKTKDEIRNEMKRLRREFNNKEDASRVICKNIINMKEYEKANCVLVYMASFGEVDLTFLIDDCKRKGKRVVIPVTDETTNEITLALLNGELVRGAYGILEPKNIIEIGADEVDFAAIPGIAFGMDFNRIGFGKGCYDRFLKKTRAFLCGVCYDFQIIQEFEFEQHDVKMNAIVSERNILATNVDKI